MPAGLQSQRLCYVQFRKLISIAGIVIAVALLSQLFTLRYESYSSTPSHSSVGILYAGVGSTALPNGSESTHVSHLDEDAGNVSNSGVDGDHNFTSLNDGEMPKYLEVGKDRKVHNEFTSHRDLVRGKVGTITNFGHTDNGSSQEKFVESGVGFTLQVDESDKHSIQANDQRTTGFVPLPVITPKFPTGVMENSDGNSRLPIVSVAANMSFIQMDKKPLQIRPMDRNAKLLQSISISWSNNSVTGNILLKKGAMRPKSISDMNSLLLQTSVSTNPMRPKLYSSPDRELLRIRLQILNAPLIRNSPELHDSLFRNISLFKRSYELMNDMLKIYVYKEGEKPIFHQPYLRGIYASEGWFMKLMEGNKRFVVKDPRKANLFYLPFSSLKLRNAFVKPKLSSLEDYLTNYVDMIARKYSFWNRTGGVAHFIVACHDWAPKLTRTNMQSCIRVLCNSNLASGFRIGKDVSLPVTYVRTAQDPLQELGGNRPSNRSILAFFAGGMHGYLRPFLLQYWSNKEADMKIIGSMPRDIEGKASYRKFMKSSKYCICARGYEVHTPRVIESIYYECVPVIISDNYVPPFFEILDWEAFSVFVLEKDIPNLRSILLSIPEERYLEMQYRVKMVQQHFLWHRKPVKYDLFHMILHSIWYNRIFQV